MAEKPPTPGQAGASQVPDESTMAREALAAMAWRHNRLRRELEQLDAEEQTHIAHLASFIRKFEADWSPSGRLALLLVALEGELEGRGR